MTEENLFKMFAPFEKVDNEKRFVEGYATTDAIDSQGEVVDLEASFAAVDEWRKWGTIKEMHRTETAVGVAPIIEKHANKGVYIGAEIVDDQAWKKCKKGVYKGFSIGGRVLEREGNHITKYQLLEISLVDRPANPDSIFAIAKYNAQAPEVQVARGGETMTETKEKGAEVTSTPAEMTKSEPAQTPKAEVSATQEIQKTEVPVVEKAKTEDTVSKADYDKVVKRLEEMEKIQAEKAKENEAFELVLKKLETLKPEVKKAIDGGVTETPKESPRDKVKKMSAGELTGLMLKGAKPETK
jgi:hypothetical protein